MSQCNQKIFINSTIVINDIIQIEDLKVSYLENVVVCIDMVQHNNAAFLSTLILKDIMF